MPFAGIVLLGLGVIAVWSAVTNENPVSAAGAALRGEPSTTDPLTTPNPAVSAAPSGNSTPSTGTGGQIPMIRPHPGPTTSGYGPRTPPTPGASSFHAALDIDGESGDPIRAAAGGTVSRSELHSGYGNRVTIDHGNGVQTTYSHMQHGTRVPAGRRIAQGETVGLMGSTGVSTGSHLHFEVIVNGEKVNPAPWIGDSGGPADDTRSRMVRGPVPATRSLRYVA